MLSTTRLPALPKLAWDYRLELSSFQLRNARYWLGGKQGEMPRAYFALHKGAPGVRTSALEALGATSFCPLGSTRWQLVSGPSTRDLSGDLTIGAGGMLPRDAMLVPETSAQPYALIFGGSSTEAAPCQSLESAERELQAHAEVASEALAEIRTVSAGIPLQDSVAFAQNSLRALDAAASLLASVMSSDEGWTDVGWWLRGALEISYTGAGWVIDGVPLEYTDVSAIVALAQEGDIASASAVSGRTVESAVALATSLGFVATDPEHWALLNDVVCSVEEEVEVEYAELDPDFDFGDHRSAPASGVLRPSGALWFGKFLRNEPPRDHPWLALRQGLARAWVALAEQAPSITDFDDYRGVLVDLGLLTADSSWEYHPVAPADVKREDLLDRI